MSKQKHFFYRIAITYDDNSLTEFYFYRNFDVAVNAYENLRSIFNCHFHAIHGYSDNYFDSQLKRYLGTDNV